MDMVNTEVLMFAGLAMTALKLLRAEQRTATNKKYSRHDLYQVEIVKGLRCCLMRLIPVFSNTSLN